MSAVPLSASQPAIARGTRALLVACAAAVTFAAWLWLGQASVWHGTHSALLGRFHHEANARAFLYALVMWQGMMLAMMTPAFLRWMLTFAALTSRPGGAARFVSVALLAGGYFVAWLIYSIGGAAAEVALQQGGLLAGGKIPGWSAGIVLVAAGLFQFAPFKRACLTHCRNPLTFFLSRWRSGSRNGFRLGWIHGAYCVGCCWVLMITGLAMGVMNLAWMAVLTVVIAAEQVLPHGDRIGRAAGVAIAAWGIVLLLGAGQ